MQKTAKLNLTDYALALYHKYKSMARFVIVGCINTGVDFLVFTLLHSLAGADKLLCQAAGYSMGIVNSFIMNKLWTFEASKPAICVRRQISRFAAVNLASLGISIIGLNFLAGHYSINVYVSKVIVTFASQAVNYFGYKLLVFAGGKN